MAVSLCQVKSRLRKIFGTDGAGDVRLRLDDAIKHIDTLENIADKHIDILEDFRALVAKSADPDVRELAASMKSGVQYFQDTLITLKSLREDARIKTTES